MSGAWTFLFSKKGILAGTLSGRHLTVRGTGVMSQPWPSVFSTVINVYKKELYDSQFEAGKRVATYSDRCFVDHLLFKPVWPTSPREFLNVVSWRVEDGKIYIAATEATGLEGEYAAPTKGRVRGVCVIGGWVIEKDPDSAGTKVSIVVSSDLKGGLPSSIVGAVTRQQAMFPRIIEKWISQEGGGGGATGWDAPSPDVTDEEVVNVVRKLPRSVRFDAESAAAAPPTPPAGERRARSEHATRLRRRVYAITSRCCC